MYESRRTGQPGTQMFVTYTILYFSAKGNACFHFCPAGFGVLGLLDFTAKIRYNKKMKKFPGVQDVAGF